MDGDGNPTGEIDWRAEPSHLGGQDIYNGVTTNWGADWTNEGSKVDATAMAASDDYTAVESTDGLPSSFSTAAYSSSETSMTGVVVRSLTMLLMVLFWVM